MLLTARSELAVAPVVGWASVLATSEKRLAKGAVGVAAPLDVRKSHSSRLALLATERKKASSRSERCP